MEKLDPSKVSIELLSSQLLRTGSTGSENRAYPSLWVGILQVTTTFELLKRTTFMRIKMCKM